MLYTTRKAEAKEEQNIFHENDTPCVISLIQIPALKQNGTL